jgi:predicted membrane protein
VPDAAAHASARAELRRHLLVMVLGVVAVHAIGVALYYGLGVENRPSNFRRIFTGIWTVATLPVVLVGLSRVRAARLRARQARRQQQGR